LNVTCNPDGERIYFELGRQWVAKKLVTFGTDCLCQIEGAKALVIVAKINKFARSGALEQVEAWHTNL
jgi:hypothetical protein